MANLNPKGIKLVIARSSTGVLSESRLQTSELVPNGNTIPKIHETGDSISLDNRDLISHQVQEFPNTLGNRNRDYFIGAKVRSYLTQAPTGTNLMVVLYNEDSKQQVPTLKDSFWIRYFSKPKQANII